MTNDILTSLLQKCFRRQPKNAFNGFLCLTLSAYFGGHAMLEKPINFETQLLAEQIEELSQLVTQLEIFLNCGKSLNFWLLETEVLEDYFLLMEKITLSVKKKSFEIGAL